MSRDMKNARKPAKKKSGGGTLVGLFIGLVIGVLGAAAVVWYINKAPLPFATRSTPAPAAKPDSPANGQPLALPGKPGDPAPAAKTEEKPRFDFYKILPGNADTLPDAIVGGQARPDKPAAEKPPEPAKVVETPAGKDPVFLQAGSFQSPGDADNQKARLALMGLEASVQQVMVQDKVWYRVRLGPYKRLDDVNRLRADLAKQGIDASIVKKPQE